MRTALSFLVLVGTVSSLTACAPADVAQDDPGAASDLDQSAVIPPTYFFAKNYADAWKSGLISLSVEKSQGVWFGYYWLTDGTQAGGATLEFGPSTDKQHSFTMKRQNGQLIGKFAYTVNSSTKITVTRLDPQASTNPMFPSQVGAPVEMISVGGVDWIDHALPTKTMSVIGGGTGELASLELWGGAPRSAGPTPFTYWEPTYLETGALAIDGATRCRATLVGDSTEYNVCVFRSTDGVLSLDVRFDATDTSDQPAQLEPVKTDGGKLGLHRRIDKLVITPGTPVTGAAQPTAWYGGTNETTDLPHYTCLTETPTTTTSTVSFMHGGAQVAGPAVRVDVARHVTKDFYYDVNALAGSAGAWDVAACGPKPNHN